MATGSPGPRKRSMTLYCILGVSSDADEDTIRAAYRVLARRYHPDLGGASSSEKFREVTEAYETLMDPQRRESYDRSLAISPPMAVPVEPMKSEAGPFGYRAFHATFYSPSHFFDQDWLLDEFLRLIEYDARFWWLPRRW